MTTVQDKQVALRRVTEAAKIHADKMRESAEDRYNGQQPGFRSARLGYVGQLETALREVAAIRFDESMTVLERVRDLDLAVSVDVLLAVQDHIRDLRRFESNTVV